MARFLYNNTVESLWILPYLRLVREVTHEIPDKLDGKALSA